MNRCVALLLSLVLLPATAWADPPGRVGRLSLVEGEASVFADPQLGWETARINTHLTSENSVWTQPGARAEVRIGTIALRLGEATQLDIVRLDDEALVAHVPRGSVAVRLLELVGDESVVFSTPGARFQLRGSGRYRIDSDEARGESRLSVLSGNARLEVAGGYVSVDTGRSVVVAAGGSASFQILPAAMTALDDWSYARDERYAQREASRYVPQGMTGWEELDDYGVWRNEPEYGPVWYPTRVAVGWAPYRYGRWTWVRPWGWAWVDDAPWGYAPFHYGRWVSVGNRWGWYPGRHVGRPVWAPALVGWVGRPGWSITISGGPATVVGWYPLSPYERYQPWYAANVTYVNRVNHVVIVDRRDPRGDRDRHRDPDRDGRRDDNRDRGATVVTRDSFVGRRPVQGAIAPVPRDVIATQPVVSGTAVLPSGNEWRAAARPSDAPRVSGTVPVAPRFPGAADPAHPLAKPVSPPVQPETSPAAAPAHPLFKPTPAQPTVKPVPAPAQPVPKPVGPPAQPLAKPVPPPALPLAKPVPAPTQPQAKPTPAPAQPLAKPVPSSGPPVVKPVPAPAHPLEKPAPQPEGRPTAGPAHPLEKPAKP